MPPPQEDDKSSSNYESISTCSSRDKSSAMFSMRTGKESLQQISAGNQVSGIPSAPIVEDCRLAHWRKWLEERKKEHAKLAKVLNRRSGQLVMNSIEEVRAVNEDKLLLDFTNILDPPDPQRGSPAFWTIPFRLPPHNPDIPPYESQMNPTEKCKIPQIEYVTVPTAIQKEKAVLGRSSLTKQHWMNLQCRRSKTEKLARRILEIQPHKPELEDLVIVGASIFKKSEEKKAVHVPILTVSKPFEHVEDPDVDDPETYAVGDLTLEINEMVLDRKYRRHSDVQADVHVTFGCCVTGTNILKKSVILKNKGTCAITYFWRQRIHHDPNLPKLSPKDCFIFKKVKTVLLPGQMGEIKFMVKPSIPGIFREKWELVTEPNVLHPNCHVYFYLWCNVAAKYNYPNLKKITNYIEEHIKYTTVRDTVDYVFHQSLIHRTDQAIIPCGYVSEEELFYIANMNTDNRRPKYSYNAEVVEQLRELYNAFRISEKSTWDYKIDSIVNLIKLHPCSEKKAEDFEHLNQLLKPLLTLPSQVINPEFRKRQLVYNILACTINTIVDDAMAIATKFNIKIPDAIYPPIDATSPSVQRCHLYNDSAKVLYVNSTPKPLAKCFTKTDHIDSFREKYRPPLLYQSRDFLLDEMSPIERYNLLVELKHEAEKNAGPQIDRVLSVGQISEKLMPTAHPYTPSEGKPELEHSRLEEMNLSIYEEILYLKTYTHFCKAIEDIEAIILSCNISAKNTPLSVIKMISEAEKNAMKKPSKELRKSSSTSPSKRNVEERQLYARVYSLGKESQQPVENKAINTDCSPSQYNKYVRDETGFEMAPGENKIV